MKSGGLSAGTLSDRGSRPARRDPALRVVGAIGALTLIQQLVLLFGWFSRSTNEDWALLWAAARSWGSGLPREPNFWGQSYGTTFEAIPTELLRWSGVRYAVGLPLVLLASHLLTWWLPAAVAWHRGRRVWATAAVAAPMVLTTRYVVTASVYASVAGRVLAAVALALVLAESRRAVSLAAVLGIGVSAIALDSSSALLAGPVCAYATTLLARSPEGRRLGSWFLVGLGLVPAAAWLAFAEWWRRNHPGDNLHPPPTMRPMWAVLRENVMHPARLFQGFAPELLRSSTLVLVVIVGVVLWAFAARRVETVGAAAVFLAVLLVGISIPKSTDELPTVYFLAMRTILTLPVAVWFLAGLGPPVVWTRVVGNRLIAAIGMLVVVTGVVRLATWSDRGHVLQRQAEQYPTFPLTTVSGIEKLCSRVGEIADRTKTRIAVFDSRTPAYACAALLDDRITTAFPWYERRSWIMRDLARPGVSAMLFVGSRPPPGCAMQPVDPCLETAPGIWRIQLTGRSPLEVARSIGIRVRSG